MSDRSRDGAGAGDFVERLMAEETAALREAATQLQAAAAAMAALPNDDRRAALQDANLAAFEAMTATAGRQAQTALAKGVETMRAALAAPERQTSPNQTNHDRTCDAQTAAAATPEATVLSDLADALSRNRRAALRDAMNDMTAAIDAAAARQQQRDLETKGSETKDPAHDSRERDQP